MSFRVTQSMMASNTLSNLQRSLSKAQQLQDQMSTGKIIRKPSDDPSGATQALQFRTEIARAKQYSSNAADGIGWLSMADSTLTSSLTEIQKVRGLVISGANATADPEARQAMAAEIESIKQGLINQANTSYNNRPIFAGTANSSTAYAGDGTYNGNSGTIYRTVGPEASVQVNLVGTDVYGSGANSLWNVLTDIQNHLTNGSEADINSLANGPTSDLARLDVNRLNIQNRLSEVGARYHRLETMQARADDSVMSLGDSLSKLEDADLPATYVALNLQQTAYQAALAATSKVIQPSLVDFLR